MARDAAQFFVSMQGFKHMLPADQGCRNSFRVADKVTLLVSPGFQSKPWVGIRERFQR